MEVLQSSPRQYRKQREEKDRVEEAHQPKEERHVELQGRSFDCGTLQCDRVSAIDDSGQQRQSIPQSKISRAFVWKG